MATRTDNSAIISLLERLLEGDPAGSARAIIEVEQRAPYDLRGKVQNLCEETGAQMHNKGSLVGTDPHYIVSSLLQVRTRDQMVNGSEHRLTGTIKTPIFSCYEGIGSPPLLEITFKLSPEEYAMFAAHAPLTYVVVSREMGLLADNVGVQTFEIAYDTVFNLPAREWTEVSQDIPIPEINTRADIASLGLLSQLGSATAYKKWVPDFLETFSIGADRILYADRTVKGLFLKGLGMRSKELHKTTYAQMQVAKNGYHHS